MNDAGYPQLGGGVYDRSAYISPRTDNHIGLKLSKQFLGSTDTPQKPNNGFYILRRQFSTESGNINSFKRNTYLRNQGNL
ncbi:hypothetical protein D3C85_1601350 [compost metagenome]